jgi:hypothetical protein
MTAKNIKIRQINERLSFLEPKIERMLRYDFFLEGQKIELNNAEYEAIELRQERWRLENEGL